MLWGPSPRWDVQIQWGQEDGIKMCLLQQIYLQVRPRWAVQTGQ